MDQWSYVIADSGGTGTDWAYCRNDGTVEYFKTGSLHPKYVLGWTVEELVSIQQALPTVADTVPLYFYGAGCGNPTTVEAMERVLREMGFSVVTVLSDALGACRACCGSETGYVAIMGTGSVLLEYDGKEIVQRYGGFGSLLGDEGSGFYFGRMLLRQWMNDSNVFNQEQQRVLNDVLINRDNVLGKLAHPDAQQWIASLAGKLSETDFSSLHDVNCRDFMSAYLPIAPNLRKQLHLVGSYACFRQETIRELLDERKWEAGWFISHPIESLVFFHE